MKRSKKNAVTWIIFRIFFVLFIFTAFFNIYSQFMEYSVLKNEEKEILFLISQEEELSRELQIELDHNKSDSFIEKIARERLGYVKPNDILFINGSK